MYKATKQNTGLAKNPFNAAPRKSVRINIHTFNKKVKALEKVFDVEIKKSK